MRTNIDIDDALMDQAMQAGPFKTKKDAVDAGLKLLARQAAYREILKWHGKLKWEGDEAIDWTQPPVEGETAVAQAAASGAAGPAMASADTSSAANAAPYPSTVQEPAAPRYPAPNPGAGRAGG